ncbi:MAG: DUF1449 domain-containing protein [Planctomycetota bacterium]
MSESVLQFTESLFDGPVWPASVLVGVMLVYAVIVCLGLFDFGSDMDLDADTDLSMDGDVDVDGDIDLAEGPALAGVGAMTLRWLNLGKIPLVVWLSIFTSLFWTISYSLWHGFDANRYAPTLWVILMLTARNVVFATGITKLATDRLGFLSRRGPTFEAGRLIGKTCVVSTTEVSPTFGQAKFKTDAAPLLLNIRIDQGSLPRGTHVEIVSFDTEKHVYKVAATGQEVI